MTRIDDKTMIPLSWAVVALTSLLGPAIAAAVYVKGLNDWMKLTNIRLSRIEVKLHIQSPEEVASYGLIPEAEAKAR